MITSNEQANEIIKKLAGNLRNNRIQQNDTQESAAARIGVSLSTYKKMEQGKVKTQFENWIGAALYFGDIGVLD